jgi:tetratricopeptide (TPR) repeat protein
MEFVAAKCPQCGGDLQLDPQIETGFCMHCGSKIVVQDAIRKVRIDNTGMVDTWMKMGRSALDAKNYEEAYRYFTKVIEVIPEDWHALFYKGQAAGSLSTPEQPRMEEFIQGIKAANTIVENSKLSDQELWDVRNLYSSAIIEVYGGFLKALEKRSIGKKFDKRQDWDFMVETRDFYEKAIEHYEFVLKLIENYEDEISKSNKLKIQMEIVELCSRVCGPIQYYTDIEKNKCFLFGYSASEKLPFVNLYDDLIVEIRRSLPGFKGGENDAIDRLSVPPEVEHSITHDFNLPVEIYNAKVTMAYLPPIFEHFQKFKEAEKQAEKVRSARVIEYQKQKYWNDHPDEYKARIVEEKRRTEVLEQRKNKLRIEISDKSARLEELKKTYEQEIQDLKINRGNLGIFAGSQKKAIDEKIIAIENDFTKKRNELDNLKKQL